MKALQWGLLVVGAWCGSAMATQSVYSVTENGMAGIDLTALDAATYYQDRMAGPSSGIVCVTGAVKSVVADGEAFGFTGMGGRLSLWNSGLIGADGRFVHPLSLGGKAADSTSETSGTPALDLRDGTLVLGRDWAEQLLFAADSKASLQLAELTVKATDGQPLAFSPAGAIYVSRIKNAGIIRLGQDGGRLTAVFNKPFGCWSGDNLAKKYDNRYTVTYVGGAADTTRTPGYADVTYNASCNSGILTFGNKVTSATSLQASEGRTNVVTVGNNAQINLPNFMRYGVESALIRVTGGTQGYFYQPGWHGEMFQKSADDDDAGRYVVESVNGGTIKFRLSVGSIGTGSVVEFRGACNLDVSCGDSYPVPSATTKYLPATLTNANGTRIVWNHTGELILSQCPVIEGENAFPYGPGRGGVKTTSKWMTVNGTNQRFNSFYGGGTVCNIVNNDVTFTVGEDGKDCTYDVVSASALATDVGLNKSGTLVKHTNYGWTLEKVGAGTLALAKAPPKTLKVTAGGVTMTSALTLPALDLAAGTVFTVNGGALTCPDFTFAEGTAVTLANGGVLVLGADDADVSFDLAHVQGDASAVIRKVGTGTLTLTGDANGFCGSFDVQGGNLAFAAGATVANTMASVTVADGATLTLPAGLLLSAYAATVHGTAGAVDGTYAAAAAEGVTALEGLAGAGSLLVARSAGTWTGAVNDDPHAVGNWKDFVHAPDVTGGGFSATFAEGDPAGSVDLATAVAFHGITMNDAITGFTFAGAGAAGSLGVGAGGFSMPGIRAADAVARVDVTAPLRVAANGLWDWGTNTVLDLHASLAGAGTIYKTGGGALYLHATNATHTGNIVVSNGNIYAYGNEPLGTGGTLTLRVQDAGTDTMGHGVNLYLHNAVISKNITRVDGSYDYRRGIYCDDHTTNELRGAVNDGTCPQLVVPQYAQLVLSGGYKCTYFNWSVSGTVVISNKPITVGTAECSVNNMVLWCAGNKMGRYGSWGSRPHACIMGSFDLHVDEPITFTASEKELCFTGHVKLNGHNWTVPNIRTTDAGSYVTSDRPATLTVEQDYPYYGMKGSFQGAANLVKRGSATLCLDGCSNTSTGTVGVTEGTLSFTNKASWASASAVSVTGTGRLEAWTASVFGGNARKFPLADVTLADDGVYAFPDGVTGTQRVGFLYLDGSTRHAPLGVYGSLENTAVPAAFRTRHITGMGLVKSCGLGIGTVLMLR